MSFTFRPDFDQAGDYVVTFTVDDGRGGSDSETITIAVTNTNRAPVASAGDDKTATPGGTVTLDGQPLPDAEVTFQPEKGRPSYAMTDSEGHYALEYNPTTPGAKVGQHKVTISTRRTVTEGDEEREIPEKVPAQYNEETTLQKEVKAGTNQIDFDLTSDGAASDDS